MVYIWAALGWWPCSDFRDGLIYDNSGKVGKSSISNFFFAPWPSSRLKLVTDCVDHPVTLFIIDSVVVGVRCSLSIIVSVRCTLSNIVCVRYSLSTDPFGCWLDVFHFPWSVMSRTQFLVDEVEMFCCHLPITPSLPQPVKFPGWKVYT